MNRMTFIEVGSGAYGATFLTASRPMRIAGNITIADCPYTGRPPLQRDPLLRRPHTAATNSLTPTTSDGNDESSPGAGDQQPSITTYNITKTTRPTVEMSARVRGVRSVVDRRDHG
jgi:hypothetical protein